MFEFPRKEQKSAWLQAEEISGRLTSFYGDGLMPQYRSQHSGADKIKIATGREGRESVGDYDAKTKQRQELHEAANRQSLGSQRSNGPMKSSNDVLFSRDL